MAWRELWAGYELRCLVSTGRPFGTSETRRGSVAARRDYATWCGGGGYRSLAEGACPCLRPSPTHVATATPAMLNQVIA